MIFFKELIFLVLVSLASCTYRNAHHAASPIRRHSSVPIRGTISDTEPVLQRSASARSSSPHRDKSEERPGQSSEDRKKFFEGIEELRSYFKPAIASGVVQRKTPEENNGTKYLYSNNPFVMAIMKYVEARLEKKKEHRSEHEKLKNLVLPDEGCYVALELDEEALHNAYLFDLASKNSNEGIKEHVDKEIKKNIEQEEEEKEKEGEQLGNKKGSDKSDDDENTTSTATFTALRLIQKGKGGFGEKAKLNFDRLPEYKPKIEKGKKEGLLKRAWENIKKIFLLLVDLIKQKMNKMNPNKTQKLEGEILEEAKMVKQSYIRLIAELKTLQNTNEKEFYEQQRKIIVDEEIHPHDFLRRVRYNVQLKPNKDNLKKISATEFGILSQFMQDEHFKGKLDDKLLRDFRQIVGEDQKNHECFKLKQLIDTALYKGDDNAAQELQARLGAQIVSSILNAKRFDKSLGISMALSVLGTGAIAFVLDIVTWPIIISALTAVGMSQPVCLVILTVLCMFSALITETIDSNIMSMLINKLSGQSFFPESVKKFKEGLAESAVSGTIAAIGNAPLIILGEVTNSLAFVPLAIAFNMFATACSGAIVPLKIKHHKEHLTAAVTLKFQEGFYSSPTNEELNEENGGKQSQEYKKEAANYMEKRIILSMQVSKMSCLSLNSMGIGSLVSTITFLPIAILSATGKIGERVKEIVSLAVNTPTEAISFGTGTWAANSLGMEKFQEAMSTDLHKNQQMVKMIFERSLAQFNDKHQKFHEITQEELHYNYNKWLELTAKAGLGISNVMMKSMDAIIDGWGTLTRNPPAQSLISKQEIHEVFGGLHFTSEIIEDDSPQSEIERKKIKEMIEETSKKFSDLLSKKWNKWLSKVYGEVDPAQEQNLAEWIGMEDHWGTYPGTRKS